MPAFLFLTADPPPSKQQKKLTAENKIHHGVARKVTGFFNHEGHEDHEENDRFVTFV